MFNFRFLFFIVFFSILTANGVMGIVGLYRTWNKLPSKEGFIAEISLSDAISKSKIQFIRWKGHRDWVQQVSADTLLSFSKWVLLIRTLSL